MTIAQDLYNEEDSMFCSKKVCVMEAAGQLGSTLVHRLLLRGYTVHAAFQNHDEMQRFKRKYAGGNVDESRSKNLICFHADPLDYHSIVDALKGCCGLFYSFEPPSDYPTYDELMGEMEVRAAHNVMEACAQTDTLNKVVFTSSATAVLWGTRKRDQHDSSHSHSCVDERDWTDISFCKKYKLWHGLSKTQAEKAAWALAMDRGVSMVSINGGLLIHPDLNIREPYLKGAAEMYEGGVFVAVDLNFLVDAHICVFEDVSSYGRYLCFNRVINSSKDATTLANMLLPPSASSKTESLEDDMVYEQRISNQKLNKLMLEFDTGSDVQVY
ncbi:cinnamoyl-CoA reductase-like SNL6 [Nicotiana tabacum]|uniref:Cinnamoyl-CoA reductase-like SNL6 n=1 Tax=Nicotiana tabacum TaxID=4097 RepID=A0A1S4DF66_TOBAC